MPDIAVNFRIVRVNGERESPFASLTPQSYNATTMPAEFNLRLGHPMFAAVTAPLATLTRGDYRLKIAVHDRIANTVANTDADFSVDRDTGIAARRSARRSAARSGAKSFSIPPCSRPSSMR